MEHAVFGRGSLLFVLTWKHQMSEGLSQALQPEKGLTSGWAKKLAQAGLLEHCLTA